MYVSTKQDALSDSSFAAYKQFKEAYKLNVIQRQSGNSKEQQDFRNILLRMRNEKSTIDDWRTFITRFEDNLSRTEHLLELEDDLLDYYNNEEEIVISKEEELDIDNVLNLDAFIDTLGDIIKDSIDSIGEEIQDNDRVDVPMNGNNENDDIEWDPAAEANEIVNAM
ncbi:hypothetical protein C1646_822580 [Rhizophagus diaphanus]|nr:hypothetical protein C1646_822580 [Rhizophagus diaphanus] [Rhizophagus sp. MUCL 43196]